MLDFFTVGERIALYLARTCPTTTVENLVFEVSLLVEEEGGGSAGMSTSAPAELQDFAQALTKGAGDGA